MDGYLKFYPANPNLQNSFNTAMTRPCYLDIFLEGDFVPATHSGTIYATLVLESSLGTGPFRLHCAAASKIVPYAHGYFSEFHNPMRKMYPDYNGTLVTFSGSYPETLVVAIPFTLSASWWHYEEQAIYFAVWLQTHGSPKYIHQSNQIGIGVLNAVEEIPSSPVFSNTFRLGNFYPNPFSAAANIPVETDRETPITLKIYDVSGRTVRTLADGRTLYENTSFLWDGTDDEGLQVSRGVYRVELNSPLMTDSKLLIKIQ